MDDQTRTMMIRQLLNENYAYYMIQNRMERVCSMRELTLITGSSYAVHGVLDGTYPFLCSLSGASQDIFCHMELAKKAIDMRRACGLPIFGKAVIILGYYCLYDDLSRHARTGELMRIVYEPLIGRLHHYRTSGQAGCCHGRSDSPDERNASVATYDRWTSIRAAYGELSQDEKDACEYMIGRLLSNKNYFNEMFRREDNAEEKFKGMIWRNMDGDERLQMAEVRAAAHNRMLAYVDTCHENTELMDAYLELLQENDIRPVVVIPPFTREYANALDGRFREGLLSYLEENEQVVDYYDFNEMDVFGEEDFFDMDHLNDQGAIRFTASLGEIILGH